MTPQEWTFDGVTLGTVVDTNDPQQMGRVRAQCIALNDPQNGTIDEIPWASYASPFAGTVQRGTRGEDENEITGPTAYGMWGIPKVGSQVLVMCLDGNPQTRVWVGCLHTGLATHTMPHGRFSYQDSELQNEKPSGPLDTFETTIEPLHTNLREAFGTRTNSKTQGSAGNDNFEFQSRGADYQVSGITLGQVDATLSNLEDDTEETSDIRQGYQTSRIAPDQPALYTPRNLDNMVTALVSPGFHAFSMDDRPENTRVRVRTTSGHQIIMDDTNERVYISTSTGENWIEMDEKGNIDIYTSGKISAHAKHDINFTTDRSFRVYAKAGIHLNSDKQVRIQGEEDISVKTNGVYRVAAGDDILLQSDNDIHGKAGADIFFEAQGDTNIKTNELKLQSSGKADLKAGGEINIDAGGSNANILGSKVNLNSGGGAGNASGASEADPNDNFDAFYTNRVPEHEPWARVDTKNNTTIDPQFDYTSDSVGKQRRVTATDGLGDEEVEITRGENWRR
jgi:uncharacterized protein (DUF2345 family)